MTEWSGMPALIAFFGPCVTLEGDNSVMALQSFRFLKKVFKKITKELQQQKGSNKDFGIFNYIKEAN